jgi:hypothetical protein
MKNPEPERFTTASSEQMTLTPDHRMVYAPGIKASKPWIGAGPMMLIGAVVLASLWFISSGYRNPFFRHIRASCILQRESGQRLQAKQENLLVTAS